MNNSHNRLCFSKCNSNPKNDVCIEYKPNSTVDEKVKADSYRNTSSPGSDILRDVETSLVDRECILYIRFTS